MVQSLKWMACLLSVCACVARAGAEEAQDTALPQRLIKEIEKINYQEEGHEGEKAAELIVDRKDEIAKMSPEQVIEFTEAILSSGDYLPPFDALFTAFPEWLKITSSDGMNPLMLAASHYASGPIEWAEEKFPREYFLKDLRGAELPRVLMRAGHIARGLDLFDKYFEVLQSDPAYRENLAHLVEYLKQAFTDEWSPTSTVPKYAYPYRLAAYVSLLPKHPKILRWLPDSVTDEIARGLVKNTVSDTGNDLAKAIILIPPDRRAKVFEQFKRSEESRHALSFYGEHQTIPYLLAVSPEPSRQGAYNYEHFGIYQALQNFLEDIGALVHRDEHWKGRAAWAYLARDGEDGTKAADVDFDGPIMNGWKDFFDLLKETIDRKEFAYAPAWKFHEIFLVIEEYFHTLDTVDQLEARYIESADRSSELSILKSTLPVYRSFVRDLVLVAASRQKEELGFGPEEASVLDTLRLQLIVGTPTKKAEAKILLDELEATGWFPKTPEFTAPILRERALKWLQMAYTTQDQAIKKQRAIDDAAAQSAKDDDSDLADE